MATTLMYMRRKKSGMKRRAAASQKYRGTGTRRYGRRLRLAAGMNANKDRATVVEAQELGITAAGGNFVSHQLNDFPRALAVSRNFRFYRCKKIEVEFIPYANVFAPGTSFPELYFQVDRTQGLAPGWGLSAPVPSKAIMLSRGVMPIKWTAPIKRYYVPSVLRNENFIQNVLGSDVQSIAAVTSTPVKYRWYATQQAFTPPPGNAASAVQPTWGPSALQYFGAAYFIDQPVGGGGLVGTVKIKVHWEFKQPLVAVEPTSIPGPDVPQLVADLSGNMVAKV